MNAVINPMASVVGGILGRDPSTGEELAPVAAAAMVGLGALDVADGPGPAWWRPVAGEARVSRWMGETEFAAMQRSGNLQFGAGGRSYVTSAGAVRPPGTGPIRVDFNVPAGALQQAGRTDWFFILQGNVPINGLVRF